MMRSLEFSHNRRVNVWLDEPPPAEFTASTILRQIIVPKRVVAVSHRIAAVELNISHGPKASYALLGAELVESTVDGLEVIIYVNTVGTPFTPSLALKPDKVQIGLLNEYASAVVAGVPVAGVPGVPVTLYSTPTTVALRLGSAALGAGIAAGRGGDPIEEGRRGGWSFPPP